MATRAGTSVSIETQPQRWRSGREAQVLDAHERDPARDPSVSTKSSEIVAFKGNTYVRSVPPSNEKGALWAQAPDMPDRGDVLFFSRYPTSFSATGQANIASEVVPGRALSTMQCLGGRGVRFGLQLFFYDAFVDFRHLACAEAAKTWLELYVTGHDGTGAALPYVHTYLQLGHSDPVRVVIHGYEMNLAHFDVDDRPQHVDAKVDLEVFEPVYLVSPFRPVAPAQTREAQKRPPSKGCGEGTKMTPPGSGQKVGGGWSVQEQMNRGTLGRFMKGASTAIAFTSVEVALRRPEDLRYPTAIGW